MRRTPAAIAVTCAVVSGCTPTVKPTHNAERDTRYVARIRRKVDEGLKLE